MRTRQSQDETGTMWKALPENSFAERRKRCRGGKNAKQRITEAFSVNTASGKETHILIGSSEKKKPLFRKICRISLVLVGLIISIMTRRG